MNPLPDFLRFGSLLSVPAAVRVALMLILILLLVLATCWAGGQ